MRKASLKTNSGDLGNNVPKGRIATLLEDASKGRIASCIGRELMKDNFPGDVAVELLKAIALNTQ
jgi:hypothetical protein